MGVLQYRDLDKKEYELSLIAPEGHQDSRFVLEGLLRVQGSEDLSAVIPVQQIEQMEKGLRCSGSSDIFTVSSEWIEDEASSSVAVTMSITYTGSTSKEFGLTVKGRLAGEGKPTWMIPGAFYQENRFKHNQRPYPRYDYEGGKAEEMVSDYWSFRSDRSAMPVVFAWNDGMCVGMYTDEMSAMGISGLGFRGNAESTEVWLNFPYREEPVVFDGSSKPKEADCPLYRVEPGETMELSFRLYAAGPDLHAYDPFVRFIYAEHEQRYELNPWMGLDEAAELTAHGLYHWHYNEEHSILYETAAFDREFNNNVKGMGDRPHMHVGWVSGVPYAYALLTYGRRHGNEEYAKAGMRVIDKIATGLAPCGTFWAEWRLDKGWSSGWNPKSTWVQARTVSEATLFMIRALSFEREQGHDHPDWEHAIRSNLEFAVTHQREDGNFGSYYHVENSTVEEWDGAGGMLWMAALLEGAALFGNEAYREAARGGGHYYKKFIHNELIYGAPEDVHLTPTSEDAYNAVVAYVLLYETYQDREWLNLAAKAADWMMTFRWSYNLEFPRHTLLKQYDYRSRGADQASPSNQHLHNYGLFCVPESLRLWRYTQDDYYLQRTRDHLACFLQFIAREDGDFNAYKGMVTERFYNTNCFQPKGMMLTLSHAWCVGLILYACQEAKVFEQELKLFTK